MAVNLFLLLLCVLETLQHLSYPINFCNMASTCLHDGRAVCASSPDGCSRKGFLDQCDMYEYNCDYGTQYMTKVTSPCTSGYQETYILFCGTLIPTQFTQIQFNTTKNLTSNGIYNTKNSSNHVTATETKSLKQLTEAATENITSKSDVYESYNEIKPSTTPLTSTPVVSMENHNSKENTTNDYQKTIKETTITLHCCRPRTWETTIEETNILEDIPIEIDSYENKQITENTTEHNNTEKLNQTTVLFENDTNVTLTTINQKISDTIIQEDTKIFVNTEEALGTTQSEAQPTESDIEIVIENQTTTVYCCDRPSTWVTTELTNILEDVTIENNDSKENKIDKVENTDYTTQISAATIDSTDSNINNTSTITSLPDVKLHMTDPTKLPWFSKPSNICNYNCQRPLTWLTTTMKRRKHNWNYKIFV